MTRIARTLLLVTVLVAPVAVGAPPAQAVRVRWTLQLVRGKPGSILVDYRLSSDAPSSAWRLRIYDAGHLVWKGIRRSNDMGRLRLRHQIPDRAGRRLIDVRAVFRSTGERFDALARF